MQSSEVVMNLHDIWHVNLNKTIAAQASKGWEGVLVVFSVNIVLFLLAMGLFALSRSGPHSLYCMGGDRDAQGHLLTTTTNHHSSGVPKLPGGETSSERLGFFLKHLFLRSSVADLREEVGDEGAFYLLFQRYSLYLLLFMSVIAMFMVMPLYIINGVIRTTKTVEEEEVLLKEQAVGKSSSTLAEKDKLIFSTFEITTIRTIANESDLLWIPVSSCFLFTIAFFVFIRKLSIMCNNRDPSKWELLCMKPSSLSAKSIFINRYLPKDMDKTDLLDLLHQLFPGYLSDVSVVYNMSEYKRYRNSRMALEAELERSRLIAEHKANGTLPWALRLFPGNAYYPIPLEWCLKQNPEAEERSKLGEIRLLQKAESESLKRIIQEKRGVGRAFFIFRSSSYKARFVRHIRKKTISERSTLPPEQVKEIMDRLNMTKWDILSAPEPADIDWDSVSYPFVHRTVLLVFINFSIFILLLVFTSPVAVIATFTTGIYSGAANLVSKLVDEIGDFVANLSPTVASMMFAYIPTLILVCINAVLLNVLYYAGRLQPIFTHSGKEQKILRISSVYLLFNTLFVPIFTFASIATLFAYLKHNGQLLDILGKMFLHNSGIFFINYVIQRAFIGTAVVYLRFSEFFQFLWLKPRAITPSEHRNAVEAEEFYSGTQFALQISVLTIVISFSTVVPVIVPFGAFYMFMQHIADKYCLTYVRPRIPGRGNISQTAIHATVYCIIIYQAGMAGFFLARGTKAQSTSIIVLLMFTYIVVLWWYIHDKQFAYRDTENEHVSSKASIDKKQSVEYVETDQLLSNLHENNYNTSSIHYQNPIDLYREPALRTSKEISYKANNLNHQSPDAAIENSSDNLKEIHF